MIMKACSGLWPTSQSTSIITLCLMAQTCLNRPATAQRARRGYLLLTLLHQDDSTLINHRRMFTEYQKCLHCTGQNIPRATLSLQ